MFAPHLREHSLRTSLMLILTLLVKTIGIVRPLFQLMSTFSTLEHRRVNFVACYTSIQFYSDWLSFVRGIHYNSGKSGLCTSLFSFEVHLKFPSWRNLVFLCVTQMIVSSSCPFCISPVLFVVVILKSSGLGAQRVAHFKTVDFPRPWFTCGWQNRHFNVKLSWNG